MTGSPSPRSVHATRSGLLLRPSSSAAFCLCRKASWVRGAAVRAVDIMQTPPSNQTEWARSVLFRLLGDFLVPATPRSDLRAHLPAERLRCRLDGLQKSVYPSADD